MDEMDDRYMTTNEASEQLGYTVQHTRLLIRQGKLQANKFGRDWMIVRESVAAYQANHAQGRDAHVQDAD